MERTSLSTRDLAHLLDINVSTVKRWADTGQLPCSKTPGGHRRFRIEDVQLFLSNRDVNPRSLTPLIQAEERQNRVEEAILNREWDWLGEYLLPLGVSGEYRAIVQLFNALYVTGLHPATLCDQLVAPVMTEIGQRWASNQLCVTDEHVATHVIGQALEEVAARWSNQKKTRFSALCACLPEDYHSLPCLCIRHVLRYEGWDVTVIGANTPVDALISAVHNRSPDLVALSATLIHNSVAFASDCARIAHEVARREGHLVVGGMAITAGNHTDGEGINFLTDMRNLTSFVRERFCESQPCAETPCVDESLSETDRVNSMYGAGV
jgi:MerR family transcriptional regulator, light-induced transcriptional regulator